MKNWLLYFFAVLAVTAIVPFAAEKAAVGDPTPKITVLSDGNITELSAEEFALRVLVAEGENIPEREAKKALAVVARSLAAYIDFNGYKHQDFDLCSDPECCVALASPEGASPELLAECVSAVEETCGTVLFHDRLPAATLFTYCAGSGTQAHDDFNYLCSVAEAQPCTEHITELELDYPFISSSIPALAGCSADELIENSVIAYNALGKCEFGVFNGVAVDARELAEALSLPSNEFALSFGEESAVFTCYGEGSGFGLDICGAERMAKSGKDHYEIIAHYYPELELNKIY